MKALLLLLTCIVSTLSIASVNETNYTFSANVQSVKDRYQKLLNAYMSDPNDPISPEYSKELTTLLKEGKETKLKTYFEQQTASYIKHLKSDIQKGDPSASMALLEYVLFFQNDEIRNELDLKPIEYLSDQDNAYASYLLAQYYGDHSPQYMTYLEKAGHQGSPIAQRTLVDEYNFRRPIEQQDEEKAQYWKEQAIKSMGEDAYQEEVCKLANCETGSFKMVDFSKLIEDEPVDSPARVASDMLKQNHDSSEQNDEK